MQASTQGLDFHLTEQHRSIHANIRIDVEHAWNHLITSQQWRPLTETRKATNNGDGLQDAQYNLTSVKDVFIVEHP